MLRFASKQGGHHPNLCKGVPSQGWRAFNLSSPPTTSKGEILESSPGTPIHHTRGDYSNPRKGVFQPRRVVGFDFKPPTQHPKGRNITTPARGVSLSQGGDNSNPRNGVFNSQGWWVLILSPLPTLVSGKHYKPHKGVQLPRVVGFDFKSPTNYP
jgi:hypothetical protein